MADSDSTPPTSSRRRLLRWGLTAGALPAVGPLIGCGDASSTDSATTTTTTSTTAVESATYEYDYDVVAPLAMMSSVPTEALPSKVWLLKVGIVSADLLLNTALVAKTLLGASAPDTLGTLSADHPLAGVFPRGTETTPEERQAGVAARIDQLKPSEIQDWFDRINRELISPPPFTTPVDEFAKYDVMFQSIPLPDIARTFQEDSSFANLRVAGPNPTSLVRVGPTGLPDRFPVTEALFRIATAGTDSLAEALRQGRLYMLNYAGLTAEPDGTYPSRQKYGFEPIALFVVPPVAAIDRSLVPVAIQCGQDPLRWPIVVPGDGANWLKAKTVVQIADACWHELGVHTARTHLMIEPFPIATHNRLPATHPLRRLLDPHFEGTLFVNAGVASTFLGAPGGLADTTMTGTVDASRAVSAGSTITHGFRGAYLPGWLADQGLDDTLKLPVFPFRDDGLLMWNAIGVWVRAYVGVYWPTDDDVVADGALQAWAREIASFDGGRLADFGETQSGAIRTTAYLAEALQMIVWTASGLHAAVNFPQATVLSYAPAMPFAGYTDARTPPPTTQADVLRLMPPFDQAFKQLNGMYIAGSVYYTRLGEYAAGQFDNPAVQAALRAFRERLAAIEAIVIARNRVRRYPYEHLLPSKVPQSINI